MLRAGVDDAEIARAVGINVSLLFTLIFAVGAALAAFAGVLAAPMLSLYPGADFDVLILAFVVVIIGGLGSLRGALAGALLVGILNDLGKEFFPEFALFTVFVPMAVILVIWPTGLFGRR
jgi:branched-chain amino acid transport system permease protein